MATKQTKNNQTKKPKRNPQVKAAFTRGKNAGIKLQHERNELEKQHAKEMASAMQAGPLKTATVVATLYDNNDCQINVSGDFSVILTKMHEIQSKSIMIDKGEFFAVAAKMMAGKESK